MVMLALAAATVLGSQLQPPPGDGRCTVGATIPHSNRTTLSSGCGGVLGGVLGDECAYRCDAGYIAVGRHVCQEYAPFTSPPPFCAMGKNIDFAVRLAAMPGRHSGDQIHKVKKAAAPLSF